MIIYFLPGSGVGLMEHSGIWTILIGDTILLYILTVVIKLTRKLNTKLPIVNNARPKRYLRKHIQFIINSIILQNKYKYLLICYMGVGLILWANNAYQTIYPTKYYSHDVCDALSYKYSYIAMRIALGTSWVIIYPVIAYAFLYYRSIY